jgi:hypothetical protein
MGTSFTGKTPASTYRDIIQLGNSDSGMLASLLSLCDGFGLASALQISTLGINVTGTATFATTLGVTGASTFTGNASFSGTISVTGVSTFNNSIDVSSTNQIIFNSAVGLTQYSSNPAIVITNGSTTNWLIVGSDGTNAVVQNYAVTSSGNAPVLFIGGSNNSGTGNGGIVEITPGIGTGGGTFGYTYFSLGSVVVGNVLSPTATDGYLYLPNCSGTPTGVPTTHGSAIPMVVDSTDLKIWFFISGAWHFAQLT